MNTLQFLFLCVFVPIITVLYFSIGFWRLNRKINHQFLSGKGSWLLTRYGNQQISIAPIETPAEKVYLQVPDGIPSTAKKRFVLNSKFSNEDNYLGWFIEESQGILIFDLPSGQLLADLQASDFNTDKILFWAWHTGLTVVIGIKPRGGKGEKGIIWDIQQKKITQTLDVPRRTTEIQFSPDGNLICTEQTHSETKFSLTIQNQVTQKTTSFEVKDLHKWCLCGNLLLAESFIEGGDDYYTIIRIWDIEAEKLILEEKHLNNSVTELLPHPDQIHVFIRWEDRSAVWNIPQNTLKPIDYIRYRLRWTADYSELRYLDDKYQLHRIPTPEFRISR